MDNSSEPEVITVMRLSGDTYNCESCANTGWWCRGCGYHEKMKALILTGLTRNESEEICDDQFGPCDEFGPCYICNRDGSRPLKQ